MKSNSPIHKLIKVATILIVTTLLHSASLAQVITNPKKDDTTRKTEENTINIHGRIVDDKSNPVSFATIVVSSPNTPLVPIMSVLTKDDGKFLVIAQQGEYIITVRFIGYKTVSKPFKAETGNLDLGEITLEENPFELNEVVVRPLIEINAREVTYNITSDPDRETSNMLDILSKMPLISFGFAGKPIIGDNASYYVMRNGRRDPLFDESIPLYEMLRRLPAMGFTKITITSSPPDKRYEYAINITADKTKRLWGAVGGTTAGYDFSMGKLSIDQYVVGSADEIRFNASAGYTNLSSPKSTLHSSMESTTTQTFQEQYNSSHNDAKMSSGRLSTSFDIAPKQFVGISFSFARNDNRQFENGYFTENVQGVQRDRNNTSFMRKTLTDKYNGSVNYESVFKNPKRRLSLFYTFTRDDDEISSSTAVDGSVLSRITGYNPQDKTDHYISTNYADIFFGKKLQFNFLSGYLMSDFKQMASYYDTSEEDTAVEQEDRYRYFERSIRRFDGTAEFSFLTMSNKMHIKSSARWDYFLPATKTLSLSGNSPLQEIDESGMIVSARIDATYFLADMKPFGDRIHSMMRNNPSLLQGAINSLFFSYNLSQRRPTALQLTNFVDERNPLFLTTGNPNLNNERFHRLSFRYKNRIVFTNIEYNFSPNRITSYWYRNAGDQLVETYANAGRSHNISGNLFKNISFSHSPLKLNGLNVSISGAYSKLKTYDKISENRSLSGRAQYNLSLLSNIHLMAGVWYQQNWASGFNGSEVGVPVKGFISLSGFFNITPSTRLHCNVNVNNIGAWNNRSNSFIDSNDFTRKTTMINNSTPISFSLKMYFGKFKVTEVRQTIGRSEIEGFSGQDLP